MGNVFYPVRTTHVFIRFPHLVMHLATRLASGAVMASMALTAVPASALTIDLSGNSNLSGSSYGYDRGNADAKAGADVSAKASANRNNDRAEAKNDIKATARTAARLSLFDWWKNDRNHDKPKTGSGWWNHGSGSTVSGSGQVMAGYEKSIDASLKVAANLSAKMSKRMCAWMGEDGDSLSACMSARKDKIKAAFNAMIDAAFTASVTTDND